jgi:hypothetical protein
MDFWLKVMQALIFLAVVGFLAEWVWEGYAMGVLK